MVQWIETDSSENKKKTSFSIIICKSTGKNPLGKKFRGSKFTRASYTLNKKIWEISKTFAIREHTLHTSRRGCGMNKHESTRRWKFAIASISLKPFAMFVNAKTIKETAKILVQSDREEICFHASSQQSKVKLGTSLPRENEFSYANTSQHFIYLAFGMEFEWVRSFSRRKKNVELPFSRIKYKFE